MSVPASLSLKNEDLVFVRFHANEMRMFSLFSACACKCVHKYQQLTLIKHLLFQLLLCLVTPYDRVGQV